MFKSLGRLLSFSSILFFVTPTNVLASQEFFTNFSAVYEIDSSGASTVTQNIQLTNQLSNVYATQYALEIGSTRIDQISAFDNAGNPIKHKETTTDNKTVIVTNFDKKVVGKGQTLDFNVKYHNVDASQKMGNILEINIPKVSSDSKIDKYEVIVRVPLSYGTPKIVTPTTYASQTESNYTILKFTSDEIMSRGITAIFGDMQVFDFSLTYNLENPTVSNAVTQIALPPDTPYQKMYYQTFSKLPESIVEDDDNNWIATYKLDPKERVSVKLTGTVVIYMEPLISTLPSSAKTLENYLKPQKYWESSPSVKDLAAKLKTPESIYNYLVTNFTYNYDRINSGIGRLGATDAIKNPDNAICTEFTDAFIAIARAAGIPAREVNGFAYTQNSILKPLSLIQDVLHSWPEYYDKTTNRWVPIDPTWGNTTGGVDYFSHLDFNHFVFAYHGTSSERPYPAGYYKFEGSESKDLQINFGDDVPNPQKNYQVSFTESKLNPFSKEIIVKAAITNLSNQALYRLPITANAINANITSINKSEIQSFLPLAVSEVAVKLIPTKDAPRLQLSLENNTHEYELKNNQSYRQFIYYAFGIILGSLIVGFTLRARRVLVSRRKK